MSEPATTSYAPSLPMNEGEISFPSSLSDSFLARLAPAGLAMVASRGRWVLARHLALVNRYLLELMGRKIKRLIVEMPPRHGKSELISKYLPAWYLGNCPSQRVILASYEASFAASWGRKARDILEEFGPSIFGVGVRQDSHAADNWEIEGAGGGMVTAGAGGPIVGRGADLFIIDDPIKNAEEAMSPLHREKLWDWWQTTARTRLEPEGIAVVMSTRWHEDDLIGRLLKRSTAEGGETWTRLCVPALAEDPDPIGRKPGEALWPERFDVAALGAIRVSVGSKWWAALFQQRPRIEEGQMFKRDWVKVVDRVPDDVTKMVRYWDLASTEADLTARQGPCFTAGCLMGRRKTGAWIILDMKRMRASPGAVEAALKSTAISDGKAVDIWVEQEPGSAGEYTIQHFQRDVLNQFTLRGDRVTGPKELRASPMAAAAEAGNLEMLRAPWNSDFLDEMEGFPTGQYKDQVDAAGGAYDKLADPAGAWLRFLERRNESVKSPAGNGKIMVSQRPVMEIPGAAQALNGGNGHGQ